MPYSRRSLSLTVADEQGRTMRFAGIRDVQESHPTNIRPCLRANVTTYSVQDDELWTDVRTVALIAYAKIPYQYMSTR